MARDAIDIDEVTSISRTLASQVRIELEYWVSDSSGCRTSRINDFQSADARLVLNLEQRIWVRGFWERLFYCLVYRTSNAPSQIFNEPICSLEPSNSSIKSFFKLKRNCLEALS